MSTDSSLLNYIYSEYLIKDELQLVPDPDGAFEFYRSHLIKIDKELDPLLKKYNFKSQLPSWKWELFAAILVGDAGKNGNGADLTRHEVKSAGYGSNFEFQYFKKSWKSKIEEECQIDHIFVSYWNGYQAIDVRIVEGAKLSPIFKSWMPAIEKFYVEKNPIDTEVKKDAKRWRNAIPFKKVISEGKLVMAVRDGERVDFVKNPHLL